MGEIAMRDSTSVYHVQVVRVKEDGTIVVWCTPTPAEGKFCAGHFGVCQQVDSAKCTLVPLDPPGNDEALRLAGYTALSDDIIRLSDPVIAPSGDGYMSGMAIAFRDAECLVRFDARRDPQWYSVTELQRDF